MITPSKYVVTDAGYETPCWVWKGARFQGYGMIWVGGRSKRAHRINYEHLVGPIPEGLVIDHLCRNRACINPDHLEPVTNAENLRRGREAITHCKKGHPFSGENLLMRGKYRTCRICRQASERKRGSRVVRVYATPATDDEVGKAFAARREAIVAAYCSDASMAEIAERFGISQQRVSQIASCYGFRRRAHIAAFSDVAVAPTPIDTGAAAA